MSSEEPRTSRVEPRDELAVTTRQQPIEGHSISGMIRRRVGRRGQVGLALALVGLLALVPALVLGTITFSDVPPSNPFYGDIQAIAAAGVTTGCGGGKFCPADYVTREQMAAFMNRLGALAAGKTPVVNAAELGGVPATGFLQAGDIVVQSIGNWEPIGSAPSGAVQYLTSATHLVSSGAGDQDARTGLEAPTIAGVTYGLKSTRVCFDASSGGASITIASLVQGADALANITTLVDDETSHPMTSAGCVTLTPSTVTAATGPVSVYLNVNFGSAGTAVLTTITSTWTPAA